MCAPLRPIGMTLEKTSLEPQREMRWWFPAGSIVLRGTEDWRWEFTGTLPDSDQCIVTSGRFSLEGGIGWVLDEEVAERMVPEDPSESWFNNLEPFPFCHIFHFGLHDTDPDGGPWFCMDGVWGPTREDVENRCQGD